MQTLQWLYLRELTTAWRERGVWFGTFVLPILLGPVTLWLLVMAVSLATGHSEQALPRVALWSPSSHLQDETSENVPGDRASVDPSDRASADETEPWQGLTQRVLSDPELEAWTALDGQALAGDLTRGQIDLVLEILPASGQASDLPGNRRIRLSYDAASDRSRLARQRVQEHLDVHRDALLKQHAEAVGLTPPEWQVVAIERRNLATDSDVGAFILSLLVPLLTVIMVTIGCIFPAIETIAGERERQTWETTLSLAVPRHQIILAKYLYVATCGALAGLLNLLAVSSTLKAVLAPLLGGDASGLRFAIPWQALPMILVGIVLLALFVAAGMMMLASLAQTFREGQALVGPFLLLCLLPLLLVQSPETVLGPSLVWVPVANVMLLLRQLIGGVLPWGWAFLTLLFEAAWVLLFLSIARRLAQSEALWMGTLRGGFMEVLRRLRGRSGDASAMGG